MLKALLSPGKESSLTHLILEGSAQILHTREVVVDSILLNFANQNPNVPEKKIMCREEDKQTLKMNRFIWRTTDYKETVQS